MIEYDRVLIKRTRGRRLKPYVLVICQKLRVKLGNVVLKRCTLLVNFSYKKPTTIIAISTKTGVGDDHAHNDPTQTFQLVETEKLKQPTKPNNLCRQIIKVIVNYQLLIFI